MTCKPETLKPFISYYGGKYRAALHYPVPLHDTIIEPFAGSAGYSLRYPDRNVVLYDTLPEIVGVWDYLIRTSADEIRRLPATVNHVSDLPICEEAKWLIGFWLNTATVHPCKQPGAWMRGGTRPNGYWGHAIRERIASQVDRIRHWKVYLSPFDTHENIKATWFVDPPYNNKAGLLYKHKFSDYERLAEWCKTRKGQVIVCENEGATWLPFVPFREIKSNPSRRGKGTSKEAIWLGGDQ